VTGVRNTRRINYGGIVRVNAFKANLSRFLVHLERFWVEHIALAAISHGATATARENLTSVAINEDKPSLICAFLHGLKRRLIYEEEIRATRVLIAILNGKVNALAIRGDGRNRILIACGEATVL